MARGLAEVRTLWPSSRHRPGGIRYVRWLRIECLLLDACDSNSPEWRAGLRRLVPRGETMVLFGTTGSVTWPEAVTYTTAFYWVPLADAWSQDRDEFQDQVLLAHRRAAAAYQALHREQTRFRASMINGRA